MAAFRPKDFKKEGPGLQFALSFEAWKHEIRFMGTPCTIQLGFGPLVKLSTAVRHGEPRIRFMGDAPDAPYSIGIPMDNW